MTSNLEQRFNRHNKGQNKTTRSYAPFRIVYTEVYETRSDARKREKYFKSGVGREFIKSKIHELE